MTPPPRSGPGRRSSKCSGPQCARSLSQPRAEFIVGVKQEPGLGHALIIGRGGTAVEEFRDYALLLLPASVQQVTVAVSGLAITQKLRLDEAAQSALDQREQWIELDVNPLILDINGSVTAVDALLRMKDHTSV